RVASPSSDPTAIVIVVGWEYQRQAKRLAPATRTTIPATSVRRNQMGNLAGSMRLARAMRLVPADRVSPPLGEGRATSSKPSADAAIDPDQWCPASPCEAKRAGAHHPASAHPKSDVKRPSSPMAASSLARSCPEIRSRMSKPIVVTLAAMLLAHSQAAAEDN